MKPLIISAVKFEATPTLEALESRSIEHDFFEFGIGCLKAAESTSGLRKIASGRDVIYLGTCGLFGEFTVPELVRAKEVLWSPVGERLGYSYGVQNLSPPLSIPIQQTLFSGLPEATVLCSPSISTTDRLPETLNNPSIKVENLELYSVLPALLNNVSSLTAILGITNGIGPAAHAQWKENFKLLSHKTADYIGERFDELQSEI